MKLQPIPNTRLNYSFVLGVLLERCHPDGKTLTHESHLEIRDVLMNVAYFHRIYVERFLVCSETSDKYFSFKYIVFGKRYISQKKVMTILADTGMHLCFSRKLSSKEPGPFWLLQASMCFMTIHNLALYVLSLCGNG